MEQWPWSLSLVAALVVVKLAGGGSSGGPPREPLSASDATTLTGVPLDHSPAGRSQAIRHLARGHLPGPVDGWGKAGDAVHRRRVLPDVRDPAVAHGGGALALRDVQPTWPQTHSSVTDGNIPTVSFYGSTFTSPYLTFTPVETTTNQPSGNFYKPLETPTPAAAGRLGGELARRSAVLSLHRYRRQVAAANLAVLANPPGRQKLQPDPGLGRQQQHLRRCLHRRFGRGSDSEDLHRDRREAGRHVCGLQRPLHWRRPSQTSGAPPRRRNSAMTVASDPDGLLPSV